MMRSASPSLPNKFPYGVNESIPAGTYRFGVDIAPGWYAVADPSGIVATPVFFPSGAMLQSDSAFVLFSASDPFDIESSAPVPSSEVRYG